MNDALAAVVEVESKKVSCSSKASQYKSLVPRTWLARTPAQMSLQQRHVLQRAVKCVGSGDLHTRATFFWHFPQFTRVAHGNGGALKAEVQSKFHKKQEL